MKAGFVAARLPSAATIASVVSQTKPRVHQKPTVSWHTTLQARSSVLYLLLLIVPRKGFCVYTHRYNRNATKKQKVYQLSAFFLSSLGRLFRSSVPNVLKIFCTFSSILPADFTTLAIVTLICSGVSFVTS